MYWFNLYYLFTLFGSFQNVIALFLLCSTGLCGVSSMMNLTWAIARQIHTSSIKPEERESDPPLVASPITTVQSSTEAASQTAPSQELQSPDANYGFPIVLKTSRVSIKMNNDAENIQTARCNGSVSRSRSLPNSYLPNYQNIYNSHTFASHNMLSDPSHPQMKPIKGHKFGSVITLKERNLLAGGISATSLSSRMYPKKKSQIKSNFLKILLTSGALLMLSARLTTFVITALLIGPWIYMTVCE